MPGVDALRGWIDAHREQLVDELAQWVRIPSVSGLDEHEGDLRRSAAWLAERFTADGADVQIWADGPPAVCARWRGPPDAPTVLVYSHHDVRRAKDELWSVTPPFVPVLRDKRLYGRGSSDAKGQVLAHLWASRALIAQSGALPVNLVYLVEGEEEMGSPHLAGSLRTHAHDVAADVVMVSDTMLFSADRPAVCVGNRGLVKGQVQIDDAHRDVHSGAVSGAAPNPVNELLRVLGRLTDQDGRVAVPGFYDDVREVSEDERRELRELGEDEGDWLARTGTFAVTGERGRSLAERLYTRPAAEVLSVAAGDVDPPTRGVIPASAMAQVQLSLVPDQRPEAVSEQFQRWFESEVREGFTTSVEIPALLNQPPYATPQDHPAAQLLREVMGVVWAGPVRRMRNAGSGPGALLAQATGAPVVYFGTGLPQDRWHAPDESVDLDVLVNGATTLALLWSRLPAALSGPALNRS